LTRSDNDVERIKVLMIDVVTARDAAKALSAAAKLWSALK
jgi:hypothetical protein